MKPATARGRMAPPEIRIPADAFARLARRCVATGPAGRESLHEAGRVTGEAIFGRLDGGRAPERLEPPAFWAAAGARIERMGLGRVRFEGLRSHFAEITVEARAATADGPGSESAGSLSPFTVGLLAGLLGRAADAPVAVLEISEGRFLAGAPERIRGLRGALDAGGSLAAALNERPVDSRLAVPRQE